MNTRSQPTQIRLRRTSRLLAVTFNDGRQYELPFEYLRVFSPSAEVRGHGGTVDGLPKILVIGKEDVNVARIEPVGNYAVRLVFDDGHDSGIYSWPVLRELGENFETYWRRYLERLEKAGVRSRVP
ncbi:MAG TPA: DUF971 domain-containing protein [Gammaproteobacteria bacterium]